MNLRVKFLNSTLQKVKEENISAAKKILKELKQFISYLACESSSCYEISLNTYFRKC